MSGTGLPTAAELARTLTTLIGKPVAVAQGAVWAVDKQGYVGAYEDNTGVLECLFACDLSAAASLGAALTRIPPGAADQAAKTQKLTPEMVDNAREVANVCANSFHEKRVRLFGFVSPGAQMPGPVGTLIAKPARRLDLTVTIAGYPQGKLSLMVA